MRKISWFHFLYFASATVGVVTLAALCVTGYWYGYENALEDAAFTVEAIAYDEPVETIEAVEATGIRDLENVLQEPTDVRDFGRPVFWNKPHPNAKILPSGLAILNLGKTSQAIQPNATDEVEMDWRGWTSDGKEVDDSYRRNNKRKYPLSRFIPGFSEAIQNMREGEMVRVWIPADLGYKNAKGKPQGTLIFDVQLHRVLKLGVGTEACN